MYAFIEVGGKQYKVAEGMKISVLTLKAKPGDKKEFAPKAVFNGTELLTNKKDLKKAKVVCEVVEEKQGRKVYSFKKTAKTGYKRGVGYRDHLTVLKVAKIATGAK